MAVRISSDIDSGGKMECLQQTVQKVAAHTSNEIDIDLRNAGKNIDGSREPDREFHTKLMRTNLPYRNQSRTNAIPMAADDECHR